MNLSNDAGDRRSSGLNLPQGANLVDFTCLLLAILLRYTPSSTLSSFSRSSFIFLLLFLLLKDMQMQRLGEHSMTLEAKEEKQDSLLACE